MSLYDLTDPSDLQFILNKELLQICVGKYQIILKCEEKVVIDIECESVVSIFGNDIKQVWRPDAKFESNSLFLFLGKRIIEYEVLKDNGLRLCFENVGSLTLVTHDQFESYSVANDSHNIIV